MTCQAAAIAICGSTRCRYRHHLMNCAGRFFSVVLLIAGMALAPPALGRSGSVEFKLTFKDLPAEFKPVEQQIEANVLSAARTWADLVDARPCTIDILFRIDPAASSGRGSGRSFVTARFKDEKLGDKDVEEQGWAAEMRTGKDPNGNEPDIELVFEPTYMRTIWWDPQPQHRRARVPSDKLDGMTVIEHELAHALAFNGWINPRTGKFEANVVSTYDRWVTFDGTDFFFNGPRAKRLWGGPVPLAKTNNNYHHVCDKPEGPQERLRGDLMNGVRFEYGKRYPIGPLDLAILADCGVPLKAHEN